MGGICSKLDEVEYPQAEQDDTRYNRQKFISYRSNTLFIKEYIQKSRIGTGATSEVFEVQHRMTGTKRAVKIINKEALTGKSDSKLLAKVYHSVDIMLKMDHPNILKIYDVIDEFQKLYIITEILKPKSLNKILEEASQGQYGKHWTKELFLKSCIWQLLTGLAYLHKKGVVHRDIKPNNILVHTINESQLLIKIIDLGLACNFPIDKNQNGHAGTLIYMSPEVFLNSLVSDKQDIWSLGVTFYQLLTGKLPLANTEDTNSLAQSMKDFKSPQPNDPLFQSLSPSCAEFLSLMFIVDPEARPSAQQLLKHEYLKEEQHTIASNQTISNNLLKKLGDRIAGINNEKQDVRSKGNFNIFEQKDKKQMQHAIMKFIVDRVIAEDADTQQYKRIFSEMDTNFTGEIQLVQFEELFKKAYAGVANDEKQSDDNIADISRKIRTIADNQTKIQFTEFLTICVSKEHIFTKKNIETAFKMLDKDKDNTLSQVEMILLIGNKDAKRLFTPTEIISFEKFLILCDYQDKKQ